MLERSQSNYLWYTSWFSLFSSLYGLSNNHAVAFFPLIVFGTSLNHWRKPIRNSVRRYADMTAVVVCVSCQIYIAQDMPNYHMYLKMSVGGFVFYPLARFLADRKLFWCSAVSHSMMHLMGNMANVVLYAPLESLERSSVRYIDV